MSFEQANDVNQPKFDEIYALRLFHPTNEFNLMAVMQKRAGTRELPNLLINSYQMETKRVYIHDYRSCTRTYATLCIYHAELEPNDINELLGVEPSYSQKKGDFHRKGSLKMGGWFLGTLDVIDSRDIRYHIDVLLDMVGDRKQNLKVLRQQGYDIRLSCFWGSATGNGGPMLDHHFMSTLEELGIDIHFDIWFSPPDEPT